MMKNKPVFPSPLLFAAVLMLFLPACSSSPSESDPPQTDELIVDRDGNHMGQTPDSGISDGQLLPAPRMSDDGTFTGSKFTHTEVLNDRNGSTFNFYVKNNGKTDVEISMNGTCKTTLTAGKDGLISEPLEFFDQTYECVAKAAVDGADIDIDWAVAVRDETETLKFGETVDLIAIMPRDMPVASGTIKDDSGLDLDKKLNRDNGKYVNFYVENLGNDPVKITINGQNSRTLEAGESGHIDMEVTQGLFGGDKTYTFKAMAGTNGGTVHINYTIYQRDERS